MDTLKNVWETCDFSNEIISDNFNTAKFAVELHEFLDGTAGEMYEKSELFFENTFLTNQVKLLVKESLVRLESGNGQPVTVINSGFGGGKTHTIILLHHILNNPHEGIRFIKNNGITADYGIERIPSAKMLAIDCSKVSKNTLWGEIAYQMGQYDKFKEFDVGKKPITDITLLKSLFKEPILLLIDELPRYLLKADSEMIGRKTLSELTTAFIMDLVSAVSASKKSCMILTLTDKQQLYYEYTKTTIGKVGKIMDELGDAISRQSQIITPVERKQIYDVVRTRLVKKINNEERKKTVMKYNEYYTNENIALDLEYEDKILRSYPFHPFLIDTLYERVSTIPKFNQTRGMLRLLGRVIRQINEDKSDCKIIGLGDIQLDNHDIADELTAKLDMSLKVVIDTDCVRHAGKLEEDRSPKIIKPISRAIFVFSLHGASKKSGIKRNELKLAICRPGIVPSMVDKFLDEDIMHNFWYIHDRDGQEFYVTAFPNINAILYEHKKNVTVDEYRAEIKYMLEKLLPDEGFRPIIWDVSKIDDDEKLKVFLLDPSNKLSDIQLIKYMNDILDRTNGGGIRTYKNTIVFVYTESDTVHVLEDYAQNLVAIKKAKKDESVTANEAFVKQISSRDSMAQSQLESACMSTYCKIGYPNINNEIRQTEMKLFESTKKTITGALMQQLTDAGKLILDISPDGIADILNVDIEKEIKEIHKKYKIDKASPFLLNIPSIMDAIKQGIKDGKFGYCKEIVKKEGRYIADIGKECPVDWTGYIIHRDNVRREDETYDEEIETHPPPPVVFKYKIDFRDFTCILNFTNKVSIYNIDDRWRSAQKRFDAKIIIDDFNISISSKFRDHMMHKALLKSIDDKKPNGTACLNVESKDDLTEFFQKYEIEVMVI